MVDIINNPSQNTEGVTPSKQTVNQIITTNSGEGSAQELLAQLTGLRARYLHEMQAARDLFKKKFLS